MGELHALIQKNFPKCKEHILGRLEIDDPKYTICDNLSLRSLFPYHTEFPRPLIKSPTDLKVQEFLDHQISVYLETHVHSTTSVESMYGELHDLHKASGSGVPNPLSPPLQESPVKRRKLIPTSITLDPQSVEECEVGPSRPSTPQSLRLTRTTLDSDDEEQEENLNENSFHSKFPNLPRAWCPRNLFIHTLRPVFLNRLYETSSQAFPKKWEVLKNKDPIAAWNSLNQTVIRFLNHEYSDQGIRLDLAETSVDFYNILDLKQEIKETVKKSINENLTKQKEDNRDTRGPVQSSELSLLVARMHEALRMLTSEGVKRTGRELNSIPKVTQGGPGLGVSQVYEPSSSPVKTQTCTGSTYNDLDSDGSGDWAE